jgi:hypothetical protein
LIEKLFASGMSDLCILMIGGRNFAHSGTGALRGVSEEIVE